MEELVVCPFAKDHTMPRSRLIWHIVRCKAKSRKNLLYCPFNPTHRLTHLQYQDHISGCPQKPVNLTQTYDMEEFMSAIRQAFVEQETIKKTVPDSTEIDPETAKVQVIPVTEVIPEESLQGGKTFVEERKLCVVVRDEHYTYRRRGKMQEKDSTQGNTSGEKASQDKSQDPNCETQ